MKNISDRKIKSLLFTTTFIMNFIIAVQLKMLHMTTDEMGVLSIGAFFAGINWSEFISNSIPYYGYGQAILYTPLFMIFKEPIILYKNILILNAFLISLVPVICYHIMGEYLKINNKRYQAALAFVIGVYPLSLVYSKWAANEVLLYLIPWIILSIILKEVSNYKINVKEHINSVFLGGVLIYGYSIHGRAIGFIVSVFFVILFIRYIYRYKIFNLPYLGISLILFQYLNKSIVHLLVTRLWLKESEADLANTFSSNIFKLSDIFNVESINAVLKTFLGHFYYAIISSYGLIIVSIIVFLILTVKLIKNKQDREENFTIICFYGITIFLFGFAISIISLYQAASDLNARGDYLIYGRYFSNLTPLLIFIALYGASLINKKQLIYISLLGYSIICIFTGFLLGADINNRTNISNWNILSILPYINSQPIDYIIDINFNKLSMIIGIIFIFIISLMYLNKRKTLICVLAITFIHSYYFISTEMIIPNSNKNINQVKNSMDIIQELDDMYNIYPHIYLIDYQMLKPWSDSKFQYALPNYLIHTYRGDINNLTDEIHENSLIIATGQLDLGFIDNKFYKLVHKDLNKLNEYMWCYGEEINDFINHKNIETIRDASINLGIEKDFYSQVGEKTGKTITSLGKEGYLLYGPYKPLNKGTYNLKVNGRLHNDPMNIDIGYIDIVHNKGENIIMDRINIDKFVVRDGSINCDVEFDILADVRDYEIRVYVNEHSIVDISNITLIKQE